MFKEATPPRDKLRITGTIGAGNRAFTFPRSDGKITLNLGKAGFDDAVIWRSNEVGVVKGQKFVHEMPQSAADDFGLTLGVRNGPSICRSGRSEGVVSLSEWRIDPWRGVLRPRGG